MIFMYKRAVQKGIKEQCKKKATQRWNGIAKILKKKGLNAKCMSKFYLTVVQAILLCGAKSWVVNRREMDMLHSFLKRAIQNMTGKHISFINEK